MKNAVTSVVTDAVTGVVTEGRHAMAPSGVTKYLARVYSL